MGGGAAVLLRMAGPVEGYPYSAAGRLYPERPGAPSRGKAKRLRVLTWNIAYAYGPGSEAYDFKPRPKAAFDDRLARIAGVIRAAEADLVLLQEVDFRSRRSHYADQLAELQRACGFPYAAAAVGWSVRFLPFPLWPLERQVGPVASGGGLLSRLPLAAHEVLYHPQPAGNSRVYNAFYLRRYTQVAEIRAPGGAFVVMNSHLEDTDAGSRAASVRTLLERVAGSRPPVLVAAGDLNAGPAQDAVRSLRRAPGLEDAFLKAGRPDSDAAAYTFPSGAPDRRLDHVFLGRGAELESLEVLQVGDVSDHLPVLAVIALR